MDEETERDLVFKRLDTLGYRVGQGLVERFAKDRPRFDGTLDCIKFLCKDLWMLLFRKQIDNLKTNHRVCHYNSIDEASRAILIYNPTMESLSLQS